jgi:hypothetical protein
VCGRGGRWSPWPACSSRFGKTPTSTQILYPDVKRSYDAQSPGGFGEKSQF